MSPETSPLDSSLSDYTASFGGLCHSYATMWCNWPFTACQVSHKLRGWLRLEKVHTELTPIVQENASMWHGLK